MNTERTFNTTVIAVVVLLHAAIVALAWQTKPPQLDINTDGLSYVDLSGLSMSGATATTAEAAAEPTPTRIEPKQKPKPVPKSKPVLKPTAKPVPDGDIAQVKEKPKEAQQEQAPKVEKAEQTQTARGGANTRQDNQGAGAGAQGSGSGSGNSGSDGGSQSGSVIPPTHLGGYLSNPKPPYPPMSRENGEEGSVGLRVQVSADGRAQNVSITKSSGYRRLDNSAKQAVAKYRFRPATRGGVPIAYNYTFSIKFNLAGS